MKRLHVILKTEIVLLAQTMDLLILFLYAYDVGSCDARLRRGDIALVILLWSDHIDFKVHVVLQYCVKC